MAKTCEGKVAVITGCTNGIGQATMHRLMEEGAVVYGMVRRVEYCDQLGQEANTMHPGTYKKAVYFDADDISSIEKAIKEIYEDAGRIDIFVNNAIGGNVAPELNSTVADTTRENYTRIMDGIVGVSAECARVVVPLMVAGGGGSIINIASTSGTQPDVTRTYYGVGKAAVVMLTKQIAVQYGRAGIRCNAVCPGFTVTPATAAYLPEQFKEGWVRHAPIRRLGTPEDQANAIAFFAGNESTWVTGQVLEVCGGFGLASNMFADVMEGQR